MDTNKEILKNAIWKELYTSTLALEYTELIYSRKKMIEPLYKSFCTIMSIVTSISLIFTDSSLINIILSCVTTFLLSFPYFYKFIPLQEDFFILDKLKKELHDYQYQLDKLYMSDYTNEDYHKLKEKYFHLHNDYSTILPVQNDRLMDKAEGMMNKRLSHLYPSSGQEEVKGDS